MEAIEQAPAPAEQSPVVETPEQETPTNEAQPQEPRRSRREALEKAFEDVDKDGDTGGQDKDVKAEPAKAEPKAEAKTDDKAKETKSEGPERGPDGKFVAKDAAEKPAEPQKAQEAPDTKGKLSEPPARFSDDAKKAWAEAPESVRAEAQRAIREMEQGVQQYQRAFEPIKPFMQMAGNDPQKLAGAMQRYVNTENNLNQDFGGTIREIGRNKGYSPQQIAKMVLGEDAGQADPRDRQIMQMHQELQQLRQQTGQVTQSMQQQLEQQVISEINKFAASNPRFEELEDEIATMLKTGYAESLQDAYQKADRLNPAPAPVVEETPQPAPPAQTRPARSVTGAPNPGSNPAHRKPSNSRKEALENAMRRAGF